MKIVYYTHPFLLDCDLPLIKELQNRGNDVMVFISLAPHSLRGSLLNIKEQIKKNDIIPAIDYPELQSFRTYLDIKNIYFVNRIKSTVMTIEYFSLIKKMCFMIKRFNPDIVHVTYPLDTWEVLLLKFRKRMVLTLHDPIPHSGKESIRNSIARYFSIKYIPKIVLLNETQRELFVKYYQVPVEKIYMNKLGSYNFILNFKNGVRGSKDKINILFFGLISSYKGLEYLCESMIHVHKKCESAHLTIAGGGKLYFDFSKYKNLDYIHLKNYYIDIKELAELLNETDFVVCPYKDATQSGVIMTSYAMECPVIASNVGALKEQIENMKTGILVSPCNIIELSNAIVELCSNRQLLENMKNNIRQFNNKGISSWNIIADNYIKIYNN